MPTQPTPAQLDAIEKYYNQFSTGDQQQAVQLLKQYRPQSHVIPTEPSTASSFGHGFLDGLVGQAKAIPGIQGLQRGQIPLDAEGHPQAVDPHADIGQRITHMLGLDQLHQAFDDNPARGAGQVASMIPGMFQGAIPGGPFELGAGEAGAGQYSGPSSGPIPLFRNPARPAMDLIQAMRGNNPLQLLPKVVRDRIEFVQSSKALMDKQAALKRLGVDPSPYGPEVPEGGVPASPQFGPDIPEGGLPPRPGPLGQAADGGDVFPLGPGQAGPNWQARQTTPFPPGKGTGSPLGRQGPIQPYSQPSYTGVTSDWEAPEGPLTPQGQAQTAAPTGPPTPFRPSSRVQRLYRNASPSGSSAGGPLPLSPKPSFRSGGRDTMETGTGDKPEPASTASSPATAPAPTVQDQLGLNNKEQDLIAKIRVAREANAAKLHQYVQKNHPTVTPEDIDAMRQNAPVNAQGHYQGELLDHAKAAGLYRGRLSSDTLDLVLDMMRKAKAGQTGGQ